MDITFHNHNKQLPLTKKQIKNCIQLLFTEIGNKDFNKINMSIAFLSVKDIRALNLKYREVDKSTNILAFPELSPIDFNSNSYLGDLAICLSVVQKEANIRSLKLSNHLFHIIIHGTLHLLGYDHHNEIKAGIMENIEISILEKLKITNPYQEIIED